MVIRLLELLGMSHRDQNGKSKKSGKQFVASLQGGAGEQVWLKISNHNISVRVPVVLSAYLHLVVQNKIEVWLT